MTSEKYRNAYREVFIILQYLDKEDFNKIPKEIISAIKENMNQDYDYEMNDEIDIFNQCMLPETKAILYNLFRDYWATPEQREKILKMQSDDRVKAEKIKQEKYKTDEIFEKNNVIENDNKLMIEYNTEKWYQKIWYKIRNVFKGVK